MMKYACNAFHALKISFANEVGRVAKRLGADSHVVMDLLCQDTKLNISRAYLRPGFAFGGSCLPKDVRALAYKGKELDLDLPLLSSILPSNDEIITDALSLLQTLGRRQVGLLGLSFKAGTDDLRESPLVTLAERLLGKGFDLQIHDPLVNLDHLVGANKTYVLREIPHLSRLLAPSVEKVLDHAGVVIVGNAAPEFRKLESHAFRPEQVVVDLSGLLKDKLPASVPYHGITW
jgi:GDP-mannose 6-dehydrogenase